MTPTMPSRPLPINTSEAGSGTGASNCWSRRMPASEYSLRRKFPSLYRTRAARCAEQDGRHVERVHDDVLYAVGHSEVGEDAKLGGVGEKSHPGRAAVNAVRPPPRCSSLGH